MNKPKIVKLAPAHIRTDGGTQTRPELDENVVAEYRDAMKAGIQLPPVTVFYDGSNNWLADGFHRFFAAKEAGLRIDAEQFQGSRRDAILHAAGANASHGLRRNNETKRRAVMLLLKDEEWSQWSDRAIAEKCGVSNNFVSTLRRSSLSSDDSEERSYTTKHGTVATMKTGNIGTKKPVTIPTPEQEIAEDDNVDAAGEPDAYDFDPTNANTDVPYEEVVQAVDDAYSAIAAADGESTPSGDDTEPPSESAEDWISLADERPAQDELVETGLIENGEVVLIDKGYVDAEANEAWREKVKDGVLGTIEWPISHFRRISEPVVAAEAVTPPAGVDADVIELTIEQRVEAMPLFRSLSLFTHHGMHFRQQATLYYQHEKLLKSVKGTARSLEMTKGPLTDALQAVVDMPSPERWQGCGGCKGALRSGERGDPCAVCGSVGFVTDGQGVTADVVASHAAVFGE